MAPSDLAKSPVTSLRQGRIGMHWKLMHRKESTKKGKIRMVIL